MLTLHQRVALSAEGSAACRHIELIEDALREIRDTILLPSVVHHQRMAARIEALLATGCVQQLKRTGT